MEASEVYRYKAIVEYDGTGFVGWQVQNNGPSIQSAIQDAIYAYTGLEVTVYAAGRTDAGVHAKGQVIHFDLPKKRALHSILCAINYYLKPLAIVLIDIKIMHNSFHARFDAIERSYEYLILNRQARSALLPTRAWHIPKPLNAEKMHEAAQILIGTHNFNSFRSVHCGASSAIRTINAIAVKRNEEVVSITISARSFLHNQVRIITGCLVAVGLNKITARYVYCVLAAEDRKANFQTAPAHGLYFMHVKY